MALNDLVDERYREALTKCYERYRQIAKLNWNLGHTLDFIELFGESIPTAPLYKLNRWLGYIQGVLIERGYTTVDEERDWTRPLFKPLDYYYD